MDKTFIYGECGTCRGTGKVDETVGTPPNTSVELVECPVCKGTKVVKIGEIIKE